MSLHKLHQLSRQLFVKLFGSTSNAQRGGQRGVIILLIGFQRLRNDVETDFFFSHPRQG